jgi:hypothetical protein
LLGLNPSMLGLVVICLGYLGLVCPSMSVL